jgi:polyisoprenoid-binding protein YceI
MATAGRTHTVGPDNGKLILNTTRQGLAAQVGHDLTIEVTRWSGEIFVAEDPADSTVSVTVETGSLRVLEGKGGIKPLSEADKREIQKNARKILDSDRQPEARFRSNKITANAQGGGTIDGTLSLAGAEHPVRLDVTALGDGRYRATGRVVQSEFGIKPYTAFFGALKLADPVGVTAEVDLS